MRGILPFFGVRTAGASDEDLARGRRRVVALTGFLTFILSVASAADAEWVSGGLEYSFTSLAEAPLCESCGLAAPSLGATVRIEFALGLTVLRQSTAYAYPYTGQCCGRSVDKIMATLVETFAIPSAPHCQLHARNAIFCPFHSCFAVLQARAPPATAASTWSPTSAT